MIELYSAVYNKSLPALSLCDLSLYYTASSVYYLTGNVDRCMRTLYKCTASGSPTLTRTNGNEELEKPADG